MPIDRSYVLLESTQTVTDGRDVVVRHPRVHYIIVRREETGTIYWYSYRVGEYLEKIAMFPPEMTLHDALNLHEYLARPVHYNSRSDPATAVPGAIVVDDREHILGVFKEPTLARAARPETG